MFASELRVYVSLGRWLMIATKDRRHFEPRQCVDGWPDRAEPQRVGELHEVLNGAFG